MTSDDLGPTGPERGAPPPARHLGPPPVGGGPGGPMGEARETGLQEQSFTEADQPDETETASAERRVAVLFLLSVLGTVGFLTAYIWMKIHTSDYGAKLNYALGGTLFLALTAFGLGLVVWAKYVMQHEYAVESRHDGASPAEDRTDAADTFIAGARRVGITDRPILRRSLMLAAGVLPLPVVVLFRDLGPAPETQLRRTAWRKGKRMVDAGTGLPVKIGDLRVGGLVTVLPEGYQKLTEEDWALSPTVLIRMRPEELKEPTHLNWTVQGHVAYSKICSHAGCPISLYEQQTKHLLCPCHQSTFQADEGCRVIFGPAARALPQLPIAVDDEGYFVATSDYREPVGPSFWERG